MMFLTEYQTEICPLALTCNYTPPTPPQAIAIICKKEKTLWKLEGDLFSGGAKCLKVLLKDDEPEKVCSIKNMEDAVRNDDSWKNMEDI